MLSSRCSSHELHHMRNNASQNYECNHYIHSHGAIFGTSDAYSNDDTRCSGFAMARRQRREKPEGKPDGG